MKKVTMFANTTVASTLVAAAIAAPAFACHPVGTITKGVQDQTTSSATTDANSVSAALSVNNGDTLVYIITVKNTGASASNGNNDMNNVVLTDALPAGVQMASGQSAISEQLGTIKPGQSVTKTYTVKVTDTKDGDVITNTACYTGNSKDNKNNQKGCDSAVVKVHVPTPTPNPTPTPSTPQAPSTLPDTGSTALSTSLAVTGATILGYALNLLRLKLRSNV